MFNYHKPKVYRFLSGCCICRAKSSSSRFTDSERYEEDFYGCFKLNDKRTGKICNACVLLVKRWKKLPKDSPRNWHHRVDARAGNGRKLKSKIKGEKKPCAAMAVIPKPYITRSLLGRVREGGSVDCISSETESDHSSLAASPTPSEVGVAGIDFNNNSSIKKTNASEPVGNQQLANTFGQGLINGVKAKKVSRRRRRNSDVSHSSFIDLSVWKREKTCCGIIFKGPCGEVMLDRRRLIPCFNRSVGNGDECKHSKQKPVDRPNKSETSVTGTELGGNCSERMTRLKSSLKTVSMIPATMTRLR